MVDFFGYVVFYFGEYELQLLQGVLYFMSDYCWCEFWIIVLLGDDCDCFVVQGGLWRVLRGFCVDLVEEDGVVYFYDQMFDCVLFDCGCFFVGGEDLFDECLYGQVEWLLFVQSFCVVWYFCYECVESWLGDVCCGDVLWFFVLYVMGDVGWCDYEFVFYWYLGFV